MLLPLREIALAFLVGVLIVLYGAYRLICRWTERNEAKRKEKLPASLR